MNQTIVVIQDNIPQPRPKGIDVDSTKTIIDGHSFQLLRICYLQNQQTRLTFGNLTFKLHKSLKQFTVSMITANSYLTTSY